MTQEEIKQLVNKYPYLAPHNSWTGECIENYDYSCTEASGIPVGWHRLFYMLCKELLPHIEQAGLLDSFYFTEVKEKYGTLRVYTSCLPESVNHLIDIYSGFSKQICQFCGKESTHVTKDLCLYLCKTCANKMKHKPLKAKHRKCLTLESYSSRGHEKLQYSYRPLKNNYIRVMKMSDNDFFDYLMNN